MVLDETERQDGWEAFPDRAHTAEEYASELKLRPRPPHAHQPSAPLAPEPPGVAAAQQHQQVMELTPPQWLPDSMASVCGGCHKPFRALARLRHHCRCCGRIFCSGCSSQRVLLPPKFNTRVPERVCDTCAAMLAPVQPFLAGTHAMAAQPPVHDAVLDVVSLRAWLNVPYCSSLEQDVFKAANVLAKFTQVSRLQPEQGVPAAVLAGACGLVVMSLVKVGVGWSASFGTGVVVARNSAGQWSAPCAVALAGLGWGLQVGGELTDLLLVLRTPDSVRACCGTVHVGLGGSLGLALGPLGRSADATLMVGSAVLTRPGAAYAYSCSQGAFVGLSLEGSVITVRDAVNHAFYGLPVPARALLLDRSVGPPPAAAALYDALHSLTRKYEAKHAAPTLAVAVSSGWSLALPSSLLWAPRTSPPITAPTGPPLGHRDTQHPPHPDQGRDREREREQEEEAHMVVGSAGSGTGSGLRLAPAPPPCPGAAWLAPQPSSTPPGRVVVGPRSGTSWHGRLGLVGLVAAHGATGAAPHLGASSGARGPPQARSQPLRQRQDVDEDDEDAPHALALFE